MISILPEPDEPSIVGSKWCVNCYPVKSRAWFTYKGNSLCEDCLKKEKMNKETIKQEALKEVDRRFGMCLCGYEHDIDGACFNDYCRTEGSCSRECVGLTYTSPEQLKAFISTLIDQVVETTINEIKLEKKEIDNLLFLGGEYEQIAVQGDMGYNQAVEELNQRINLFKGE